VNSTGSQADTHYYKIEGIVCYACVGILEGIAKGVPGVSDARVNYLSECLQVTTDSRLDDGRFDNGALLAAIGGGGYRAAAVSEKETNQTKPEDMRKARVILLTAFVLSVALELCARFRWSPYFQLAFATVIQVIAGRQFYKEAYHALAAGTANMSVLVMIGTLTAYLFSLISMISGVGELFFQSSGTVVVFVLIGKYLERSAKISSLETIRNLTGSCPDEAILLTEGAARIIPAGDVRRGDRIRIQRNSIVSTDGTVAAGSTFVDESPLTGESAAVRKTKGDKVYCGTINHSSDVEIIADGDYADNVYAHMIGAIVRCLTGERPAIPRTTDRLCARFVPAVLAVAAVTLLAWYGYLQPGDIYTAVIRAVSVLIIACPCAMGIATPLAVTVGIGILGKSGIVVKNPAALETLAKADTVVFDKTGTLTFGPEDSLRDGTPITVDTLKKIGFQLLVLSGDTEEKTGRAAESAGINRWHASLTPEDKAGIIRGLQDSHTVVMVGDGVNDLLSVVSADVGVAISRAAELNIENADIILARNKITHLLKAVYISRIMLKNIRFSLFWALIYNIAGIALAVAGLINPVFAGIAMSLSSLCVVLNARQLEKKGQKITFDQILKLSPREKASAKERRKCRKTI
jgi:cation transport ATPase